MNIREQRKWQHLEHSLKMSSGPLTNGFEDINLIHQALGNTNFEDIDCNCTLFKKKLKFPMLINAMTGGAPGLEKLNKDFAIAARECGIGLAVGSQTAAINNPETIKTFKIVREYNPTGLILANISALAPPSNALKALEMIEADAIQLHLNIAQELAMSEGDRQFKGTLENILIIKNSVAVPVIIKEVGFGLSIETVQKLYDNGLSHFDIGGAGGTNFVAIEHERNEKFNNNLNLIKWGIPTAISLLEALSVSKDIQIFATGGIKTAQEILISLAIGANMVGMATPILEQYSDHNTRGLIIYIERLFQEVKELMLLINASNLSEIRKTPLIITGYAKEWLEQRGVNTKEYGMRRILG